MKPTQDELRYSVWKKVVSSVRGVHDRGSIYSTYLEQINKCRFPVEFDDVLDAIIQNEKDRKKSGAYNG